ncbi:MAG TPA: hypothetical protein VLL98_03970 [Rickettsiales bacterium]|nr:hypothetical protein [Rickettsiales bacterium]
MVKAIKKISKSSENIEKNAKINNIKKNKFSIFSYIFIILGLLSIFSFYSFFIIKKNKINTSKQEVIERYDDSILKTEMEILMNKIKVLEDEIENNVNEINVLRVRIEDHDLEIGKNSIDPQRIELIKLALEIEKYIQNGQNYDNILKSFKILMKDNGQLNYQIDILYKYKNDILSKEMINDIFNTEMKVFIEKNNILNNTDKNLAKFISKFVIVRKIDNAEKNSASDFLNYLEKNIKTENYIEAFNIIQENEKYAQYFSKTNEYIKINILVNNAIEDAIKYLVND